MKSVLESASSAMTREQAEEEQESSGSANQRVAEEDSSQISPCSYIGSSIRSVVLTPGGTKRKVKPSYRTFKEKLERTLDIIVEQAPGQQILVENLIDRLDEKMGGVRIIARKTLLNSISSILKTNVKRKGKKKELYYADFALTMKDSVHDKGTPVLQHMPVESPSQSSPVRKQRKTDSLQESRCKGKLDFTGLQEIHHENEELMGDLTSYLDDMELCSPEQDLSRQYGKITEELKKAEIQVKELCAKVHCLEHDKEALQSSVSKLEESLSDYEKQARSIIKKQEEVIQLYKDILDTGELLGGLLSLSERDAIKAEVRKTKSIFNLGLRSDEVVDLVDKINPLIFSNIVNDMKKDCPMIMNILEQLVLTENTSRNTKKTATMKMKASVHLLASLMDVRDQRSGNDIPVLFGLLCLCYGAGPSLIEILQHLGLSESFQVLIGILKKQLANYKEIIGKRVSGSNPVITYQDNMQIMRTSLRHLRLSKLQKQKVKQGKMWDFTVRGWRAADTSGIEHLFENETDATKPQRDLQKVKYEDTKIECNEEHLKKWDAFKKRNLLRKLDLSLNAVPMTSAELLTASSETLQKQASQKPEQKFKIDVLPPDEEFPDLGKKESLMYPLPISYENQCTNLGVASNLDLFTKEFGFNVKKEKKILTLKKSGKDFNLEQAYERYAFLKALETHKKNQIEYEQILRGQDIETSDAEGTTCLTAISSESEVSEEDEDHE